MGAVDLIPIYPLGEEVRAEDCTKEALGMCFTVFLRVNVPLKHCT